MALQKTYFNEFKAYFMSSNELSFSYQLLCTIKNLDEIDSDPELLQKINDSLLFEKSSTPSLTAERIFDNLCQEIKENIAFVEKGQIQKYLRFLCEEIITMRRQFNNAFHVEEINIIQENGWDRRAPSMYKFLDFIINVENLLDRLQGLLKSYLLDYPSLILMMEIPEYYKNSSFVAGNVAIQPNNPHATSSENSESDKRLTTLDDRALVLKENPLRAMFKDPARYDKLILFMSEKNLLSNTNNELIWYGYKHNRKFEVAAFYESLRSNGYLNSKDGLDNTDLRVLLNNSFDGLNISLKTIGNKKSLIIKAKYDDLLNSFTKQ